MPLSAQELNEMALLAAELGDVDAELEAREALDQLEDPGGGASLRADGTEKGTGFFGIQKMTDGSGRDMTEFSIGVDFGNGETEIPTLVPTLSREELESLKAGGEVTEEIKNKAIEHASSRINQGKNPFIEQGENVTSLEDTAEQPQGFSLAETVKNIPASAAKLGEDIIQPILHPIETAESLQSLGQGLVEKAFVPGEINGIDFGQTENEEVVDAVGGFINERYGSLDAFKNTVQNDPVGVLADIAGLFTAGSTLLPKAGKVGSIGRAVEALGKAVDPVNVTVSSAKALSKTGKLISPSVPEKLLESALKFRPSIKPAQRANMTKTALKEGIMPTVKGLRKITDKLDVLDTGLNKIIDSATDSGTLIPKRAVFAKLKQLRQDLGGAKLDASADLKVVDRMAKQFDENLKRLKKDKLTPRELQELKTDAYKRINFDVTTGKAGFAKNEARKAIAKQAKESLEAIDPNVKTLNRKMGDLLELNNELERVVTRLDNRNLISLDTGVKIAAGASTGTAAGTGAGVAASVLGAPRVKARTAMALENIRRNAETVELINNKLPPVLARTMMEQAGRLDETLREHVDKEQ